VTETRWLTSNNTWIADVDDDELTLEVIAEYILPPISVVYASREITLIKYILKNINIYGI
jgi:hypothetical protein